MATNNGALSPTSHDVDSISVVEDLVRFGGVLQIAGSGVVFSMSERLWKRQLTTLREACVVLPASLEVLMRR